MNTTALKTHQRIKRATVATCCIAALGLSGCAQIMNFGDMMWSETKHATLNTHYKVMAMLRPKAKRAEPVFVYNDTQNYHPQAYQGSGYKRSAYAAPALRRRSAVTTPSAPYPVRETHTERASAPSASMPNMAYVKLSGQTSITDWQNCQAEAGSYIQPQGVGFIVHPNFDSCMRQRGYIPEDEALVFMDRQVLP